MSKGFIYNSSVQTLHYLGLKKEKTPKAGNQNCLKCRLDKQSPSVCHGASLAIDQRFFPIPYTCN